MRIAIVAGFVLAVLATPADAGQSSATFGVGIVIGGPARHAKPPRTFTWGAAAVSVSRAGYTDIQRAARRDGLFWFIARKGDSQFRIAVSEATGSIEMVTPT